VFEHILLPFLLQNLPLAFENDWKSSEALTHYEFTLNGIHAHLESRLEEDACVGGAWDLMQLEIVGALQNDLNRMYPACGW
jgi:hypothetical protein